MAILNLDPNLVLVLAGILVVLGLVLAFFGRGILKKIIGFIGMILGGGIGYLGGAPISGGGGYPPPGPRPSRGFLGLLFFLKPVKIGLSPAPGLPSAAVGLPS